MRIAIMGSGGVGGYYGGLLAKAGQEVTFIARGAHLQAIRDKGLHVKSVHGDFTVSPVKATDRPGEIGAVDLVLVATKTYHTEEAAQAIKPLIGDNTVVISLQNGIDAAERIGSAVGMERMLGGATWLSAAIEAPGRIGQYSQFRRIALGELDGRITPRAQAVASAFATTPAVVELVPNIRQMLWTKFVFISAISALGGLTRVSMGEYRHVPEAREVLAQAMAEVSAVAQACGVALDADIVAKTLSFIDAAAPDMRPSMQRDLEAGRMSELESLIGVVVRLGRERGVPTPVMRLAYALLKPAHLKAHI
ncbi:MAG: 2-dehydropantoate 2-reductase [Deltaproteobacteria bacterium]|nr:2-dehydropantoate 2-reductase [Deltaproteobacteria bacterium]